MGILSQCEFSRPDPQRLVAALSKYRSQAIASGLIDGRLFTVDGEPGRFVWIEEWNTREALETATDRYGPQFEAEAGIEGVDVRTTILSPVEV